MYQNSLGKQNILGEDHKNNFTKAPEIAYIQYVSNGKAGEIFTVNSLRYFTWTKPLNCCRSAKIQERNRLCMYLYIHLFDKLYLFSERVLIYILISFITLASDYHLNL